MSQNWRAEKDPGEAGKSSPVRRCESKSALPGQFICLFYVISGEEMWVKINVGFPIAACVMSHLRWGDVSQNLHYSQETGRTYCHLRWGDVSQNLFLIPRMKSRYCHLRWGDVSQNSIDSRTSITTSSHLRWGDVSQNFCHAGLQRGRAGHLRWGDVSQNPVDGWTGWRLPTSSPVRRCESKSPTPESVKPRPIGHLRWGDVSQNSSAICLTISLYLSSPVRRCESK